MVYWMTGLSGSGKTTLAKSTSLLNLDGDEIRNTINSDLGFSIDDREEHIRRISLMAKSLSDNGYDVIVSTISPTENIRNVAKDIIGNSFELIYINADIKECIKRDVKGLYKKKLNEMTGIGSIYEEPSNYDYIINTKKQSIEESKEVIRLITS